MPLFSRHIRRVFVLGLLFLLGSYATLIEPFWVKTSFHRIGNPPQNGIRVVQISDLHLHSIGRREKAIIAELETLKPQLVIFSGDVIDHPDVLPILGDFLDQMGDLPIVATLGNHEHWGEIDPEKLEALYEGKVGGRFLVNKIATYLIQGRKIAVVGLDDFTAGLPDRALAAARPEADIAILVQHSPGFFSENSFLAPTKVLPPFDLCLAGHTHGGQVTFFSWAFWTPHGSGNFVAGFYKTVVGLLYVSKGLGMSVFPMRFGARPELVVFDI